MSPRSETLKDYLDEQHRKELKDQSPRHMRIDKDSMSRTGRSELLAEMTFDKKYTQKRPAAPSDEEEIDF